MQMSGGPKSVNLKLILLVIAIGIAAGTLFFTQTIVKKLQDREKRSVELYAEGLKYIATDTGDAGDLTFIFSVIQRIDFPLILTDENDQPNIEGIRNIEIDTSWSNTQVSDFLKIKIDEFREINPPILVTREDSIVVQKIYYGDSELIQQLILYPYFQIIFAVVFILIAYISFSYMKKNEQSNLWVGMSKETAHQLGTPISSLMGWSEMLKLSYENPDKVLDVADEMNSDLGRLNKIAQRFSKIGSKPELKASNVYDVIEIVIEYFKRRLPQFGKKVEIVIEGDKNATAMLNAELFEWVIENLIKNALDAIERKDGKIKFQIISHEKTTEIKVTDNGKGIDMKRRKDIFRPGYSTKRRGWGLGLSLSRRIVQDYHLGKIFVSESELQVGTTFSIIISSHIE